MDCRWRLFPGFSGLGRRWRCVPVAVCTVQMPRCAVRMAGSTAMLLLSLLLLLHSSGAKYCERSWSPIPDATVGLRSANEEGQQELKLRMENTCADDVVVYWIDLAGEEVELKRLKPGRKLSMLTATGHAFRVYFPAGFTGTRADLPESALPRSTSRQLALEHTVAARAADSVEETGDSLELVSIAPCGADAAPYYHQRITAPPSTDDADVDEALRRTEAEAAAAAAAAAAATKAAEDSERAAAAQAAKEQEQQRREQLEQELQQREAEAAVREAASQAREAELRTTLEEARAAARAQEEQTRLATEAAEAAAAAAAAASAAQALEQASAASAAAAEGPAGDGQFLAASVAVVCVLAATAAWLHGQLRESASENADLLRQVQEAEASRTKQTGQSVQRGAAGDLKGQVSDDEEEETTVVSAPSWNTTAMREAAAAVSKEKEAASGVAAATASASAALGSADGAVAIGSTDGTQREASSSSSSCSAEAALSATERKLRAALASAGPSSLAPAGSRTPTASPSRRVPDSVIPSRSPGGTVISPQSSVSELDRKLQELGARDGRLGRMLAQVRKRPFFAPFYSRNAIILPRQARDKHRES
jgi:hypothetical protein